MIPFANRDDAGQHLAEALRGYRNSAPVVLALPRGGVPVAYPVAIALNAPLDVLVVRKLGLPYQPELAFGAIGEGPPGGAVVRVLNNAVLRRTVLTDDDIAAVESEQRRELQRRIDLYRGGRPGADISGRTVVIVDDGFATGATARVAALVARARGARTVVLAAPIGARDTVAALREVADDVVCPGTPRYFTAVGQGYAHFDQTSDAQVCALLQEAHRRWSGPETGQ